MLWWIGLSPRTYCLYDVIIIDALLFFSFVNQQNYSGGPRTFFLPSLFSKLHISNHPQKKRRVNKKPVLPALRFIPHPFLSAHRAMTQTGFREDNLLIPSPLQRIKWHFIPSSINALAPGIKQHSQKAVAKFFFQLRCLCLLLSVTFRLASED